MTLRMQDTKRSHGAPDPAMQNSQKRATVTRTAKHPLSKADITAVTAMLSCRELTASCATSSSGFFAA